MDMTLPSLIPEDVFSEFGVIENFTGFRSLAYSVINDAVRNIRNWNRNPRKSGTQYKQAKESIQFLFGEDHRHIRSLWLSWLNMDEALLERMAAEERITHLIKEICNG